MSPLIYGILEVKQAHAAQVFQSSLVSLAGQKDGQLLLCMQVSRQAAQALALWPILSASSLRNRITGQAIPCRLGVELLNQPAVMESEARVQGNFSSRGVAQGPPEELLWEHIVQNPTQWWDYKRREEFGSINSTHIRSQGLWSGNWDVLEVPQVIWDREADAVVRRHAAYLSAHDVSSSLEDVDNWRTSREAQQLNEAVHALSLLVQRRCHLPNNFFFCVLKRCIAQNDLVLGRRVHALAVSGGFEGNRFLATHLIGLYASHGRLEEAWHVFVKVSAPDGHNWAAMLMAYARHGNPEKAIMLYHEMRGSAVKPDNRIYLAVLRACANARDLAAGKTVHAHILASGDLPDVFVQNCLVDMYAKCERLEDAQRVFDSLPEKNVVTWSTMIAGYAKQGLCQEALTLYVAMQEEGLSVPNSFTFVCLLQSCAGVGVAALDQGKKLHVKIVERGMQEDVMVGNSLLNFYTKCGGLEDARRVFADLPRKDVVTWTAMIAGYAQQGQSQDALDLYSCMQHECVTPPNAITFVCLLQACAGIGRTALDQGKQLHAQIEKQGLHADVLVGGGLVNMYVQCESMGDAQRVFDSLYDKNVVTWTSMIAGHVQLWQLYLLESGFMYK